MEEDLKILEKLIKKYELLDNRFNNMLEFEETRALNHLIQAYKEQQAELKRIDKEAQQYFETTVIQSKQYNEELDKKQTLINTMQAEFERLENLEDNTDMLKEELKKKDKIIDEMATEIFYKLADDHFKYGYSEEEVKQYFEKKVEVRNEKNR